jgi:hypothetical protein
MQELKEMMANAFQDLELLTITSVGTAAPSPAPMASLNWSVQPTTPPLPTPIATTSIDTNSRISTTTVEPLEPVQASRAKCSTEGRSHDEHAQVLVVAAPTSAPTCSVQSAEEDTFTTAPAKCSIDCGSQDKNALPPMMLCG